MYTYVDWKQEVAIEKMTGTSLMRYLQFLDFPFKVLIYLKAEDLRLHKILNIKEILIK